MRHGHRGGAAAQPALDRHRHHPPRHQPDEEPAARRVRRRRGEGVHRHRRAVTLTEAEALAAEDKYQFQWWALGLVGARPVEQKKGADKGIDGRLYFIDDNSGDAKQVILSVKGGHTDVTHVRDLRGVLDREQAQIGVLISMQEPTGPMKTEAASAGFYTSPWNPSKPHPKLQILTIKELLDGKRIDMPPPGQVNVTFQRAPKARGEASGPGQLSLLGDEG